MAMSPALEKILAAKRANPYSDKKSIDELRTEHRAGGAAVPLPEGTTCEAVDAGGVPAEWIACGSPTSGKSIPLYPRRRILSRFGGGDPIDSGANFRCLRHAVPLDRLPPCA